MRGTAERAMAYAVGLAMDEAVAEPCLSRMDRDACAGIRGAAQRSDFRAGRLAARRAIAAVIGIDALERIEFWPVPGAAPIPTVLDARGVRRPLGLPISLTHREGRAAAAVSRGRARVGVDLERTGTVARRHARYFLTVAEQALDASDPTELWALKEAAWKALECPESTPFSALELHFAGSGDLTAVSLQGVVRPARAELLRPWPGYILAVLWIPEDSR